MFRILLAMILLSLALLPAWALAAPRILLFDFGFANTLGLTAIQDRTDAGEMLAASISGGHALLLSRALDADVVACPGAAFTAAKSLNRWSWVTGFCDAGPGGTVVGFVRKIANAYEFLHPPDALITQALGINDWGTVVGNYRDSTGRFHGFRWWNGEFTIIDAPGDGTGDTSLTGINNAWHMVGYGRTSTGGTQAFLRTGSDWIPLAVPGAVETLPLDINELGHVAGVYVAETGDIRGFLWDGTAYWGVAVPGAEVVQTDLASVTTTGVLSGRVIVQGDQPGEFVSRGFALEGLALAPIVLNPTAATPPVRGAPRPRCDALAWVGKLHGGLATCPEK